MSYHYLNGNWLGYKCIENIVAAHSVFGRYQKRYNATSTHSTLTVSFMLCIIPGIMACSYTPMIGHNYYRISKNLKNWLHNGSNSRSHKVPEGVLPNWIILQVLKFSTVLWKLYKGLSPEWSNFVTIIVCTSLFTYFTGWNTNWCHAESSCLAFRVAGFSDCC